MDKSQGRVGGVGGEQYCYRSDRASRATKTAGELPDEPERSPLTTALPGWVGELSVQHGNRLPFSDKWAERLKGRN